MPTGENIGTRRQATLFKKAHQLSVLCDAEVAIIAFTNDGKLHEFSSTTMEHTLSRYKDKVDKKSSKSKSRPEESRRRSLELAKTEEVPIAKPCEDHIVDGLKRQHAALCLEKSRMMGKELDGLSSEELRALEEQQIWALLSVNNKKKELFVEMLERSMSSDEQRAVQEEENMMIRGFEKRRERPYVVQDHGGPDRMVSCARSDAVTLHSRPSQDSDDIPDFLQLRL